jgi:hypothetical protein
MIPTQLMPFNSSSDPNSETEYDNPSSMDLEDMRGLLVSLETLHIENPVSISRLDALTVNGKTQLWTLRTDFAQVGFLLRNKILDETRIEFFELGYIVHYFDPHTEGLFEKMMSKITSLNLTIGKIIQSSFCDYTVASLLKRILFNMDKWLQEVTSDTPETFTNSQSHSNKSSEHRQLLPAPGGGTRTVSNTRRHTNTSSEHRQLLPAPGGGTRTVTNTRRHTNTSSERKQGSIAWLDERGLHYVNNNDKRVYFVPFYDRNRNLPPPWTWYERYGLIYFTPDGGQHEYTRVQPPNSRVDNLQGLLMCLQTIQIENPLSMSRLDTTMDNTKINKISYLCERTGFSLQRHNISAKDRIDFFDLGYMLLHDHEGIKPQEILAKCRQLHMTISKLMKMRISDTQKYGLSTIKEYTEEYVRSYDWIKYGTLYHRIDNSIDTPEFDKDLATPVKPCRCAGCRCRGCEYCNSSGQDGRCRCVHDAGV